MAAPAITTAAQAYKGQSVICAFGDEWDTIILSFGIGDLVSVDSSGKIGQIVEMDMYGNSFKVTPLQPDFRFDSDGTPGILAAGETLSPYEP